MTGLATATRDEVECVAAEVLRELYDAFAGEPPRALRAYRERDTLLLLLRFDAHAGALRAEVEPDVAFMALPSIVAEAVGARTGLRLRAGDASVCAATGLAVLGFTVVDQRDSGALTGDDRWEPAPERRAELRVVAG
ncbi:MAG TPA: hypothetical protein VID68_03570 [Solirubrobacteraceae bacterium]